jgi:hypothetical protein
MQFCANVAADPRDRTNTIGFILLRHCPKALLENAEINLPSFKEQTCFTKFSISKERLFLKKFIIKSNVLENVCFRTRVKSFSDNLNLSIISIPKSSLFRCSKITIGVFLHDINHLITI